MNKKQRLVLAIFIPIIIFFIALIIANSLGFGDPFNWKISGIYGCYISSFAVSLNIDYLQIKKKDKELKEN